MPSVPLLGSDGKPDGPFILLVGGADQGRWQGAASRKFASYAAQVLVTNVPILPGGEMLTPELALSFQLEYAEAADVVLCWCGKDNNALYLSEWLLVSTLISEFSDKLVIGIPQALDHPMGESLRLLARRRGLIEQHSLETAIVEAQQRCRVRRGR